ncbi:hypothetical protein D3C85_1485910 [compost metagenome]
MGLEPIQCRAAGFIARGEEMAFTLDIQGPRPGVNANLAFEVALDFRDGVQHFRRNALAQRRALVSRRRNFRQRRGAHHAQETNNH